MDVLAICTWCGACISCQDMGKLGYDNRYDLSAHISINAIGDRLSWRACWEINFHSLADCYARTYLFKTGLFVINSRWRRLKSFASKLLDGNSPSNLIFRFCIYDCSICICICWFMAETLYRMG